MVQEAGGRAEAMSPMFQEVWPGEECGEEIRMSPPNRAHYKLFDVNLVFDEKMVSWPFNL